MSEEPQVIDALIDLCRAMQIRCVVQVGASDGMEAASIGQAIGCRAVAVEARKDVTPASTVLEFHHAIIGSTDGITEFYLHPTPELSGHFARCDDGEVKVMEQQWRLDTFCFRNRVEPDALIIDTEGTTLEVLEGAGRVLDTVRMIYAECQTAPLRAGMRLVGDVNRFLTERGFVKRDGPPAYDCGGQGNFCWVRP